MSGAGRPSVYCSAYGPTIQKTARLPSPRHPMRETISGNQRQSSGSERHLPPRSLRTRSNTPRQAKRPRDVLAAAHHGALVIGPVGAKLVLVIAGCVERRRGLRAGPSGRSAHHGASRSSGPGGAVESSRDRRHAPLIRTACRSRTASTAIRPSVVYRTFARVQLGQRRRTLAKALADETRRLGRDNEPLRSSVDSLVIALRSAPSPVPSASPTAWPPDREIGRCDGEEVDQTGGLEQVLQ